MNRTNPKVDLFLKHLENWPDEFRRLRTIILSRPLTEDVKWGQPCYMLGKSNVVLIHGFKEYCALLFFKGALLKDPEGILKKIGNTQAGRQIRFTSVDDVAKMERIVKAYIDEAIEVEKAGLKVERRKTSDFKIPEEFQTKLDEIPKLKTAFEALTPGRQRAYIFYFSGAKQSKTRAARVEKHMGQILKGKGLDD